MTRLFKKFCLFYVVAFVALSFGMSIQFGTFTLAGPGFLFWVLVRAALGPWTTSQLIAFSAQLVLCSAAYLTYRCPAYYVLIPALFFAALPYGWTAAATTGVQEWRYVLGRLLPLFGAIVLTVFFWRLEWLSKRSVHT